MDKQKNTKRPYEIIIAVTLIFCILGAIYSYFNPSILAIFIFPAISFCFALFLWAMIVRFLLHRDKRFLDKSFTKPIKFALFPAAFCLCLILLLAMPRTPNIDPTLQESLVITALAFIMFVLPMSILLIVIFGSLAFASAISHLRQTKIDESPIYRKGPLIFTISIYSLIFLGFIVFVFSILQSGF